nr:DUF2807 domain-containing protein [Arenibacter sp. H213]
MTAYTQRKPKIKGNRTVIEVKENLPFFNAIVLEDDLEVVLKTGSNEGYELEVDENLVDILRFEVENETLTISSFYNVTSKKRLHITVFFNQLNQITVNNGKILSKDTFATDALRVDISGGAKAELSVNAEVLDIVMVGNGSGDFKMEGDALNIDLKDKAKLRLYAVAESINVQLLDKSEAQLEGVSTNLQIKLMEYAVLKASKLEVDSMVVTLNSNTSAEVMVTNSIELYASGSSKTYVYGEGKINLQEFLDTSELHRRK